MRVAAALLLLASTAAAQFKSTVPLVVAPTTVTDSKGHYVDGLNPEDLILYDNNVPQAIQMDWMTYPIDLVVAVEASEHSGAVIDKLGATGILFTQLLAADAGETALITFSDNVKRHVDFTNNPDDIIHAVRMLRKEGDDAQALEALHQALLMLDHRPPGRRRIILMIAEKRDRGSKTKLPEVMEQVQRLNAEVFWVTFSPFMQPWTVKPKTAEDLKPIEARGRPPADDPAVPADLGASDPYWGLGELVHLHKPDLASLFTKNTGGRTLSFLKKDGLEQAVQLIGEEVHRQYILSFQPKGTEPGAFHNLRVEVRNRADLKARTREGYWSVQ